MLRSIAHRNSYRLLLSVGVTGGGVNSGSKPKQTSYRYTEPFEAMQTNRCRDEGSNTLVNTSVSPWTVWLGAWLYACLGKSRGLAVDHSMHLRLQIVCFCSAHSSTVHAKRQNKMNASCCGLLSACLCSRATPAACGSCAFPQAQTCCSFYVHILATLIVAHRFLT